MTESAPAAAPRIAVIGLAGRFPGAADAAALWRNLAAGVESIGRFDAAEAAAEGVPAARLADPAWVRAGGALDGAERFDAAFFAVTPREAEVMDPQHRLFLEVAWNALEDAGQAPGRIAGRVGVFAGAGRPDYLLDHVRPRLGDGGDFAGAYAMALGNDRDFLATRLSWKLDLTGPSLTVATACSTSLVAVCLAATSLAAGDCDLALAGGAALRLPQRGGYPYTADGILSPDGRCRAFDAEARGTVPGSGVGVVVLKRLEDALADGDPVRAVLCGWAVNNDGAAKVGYTAPRAEGQAAAIGEALALAGFAPATIGYVEAHGTGTALGDPIEVAALRRAFGEGLPAGSCALGSIKTNLGHLDAAAGVAGLIKAVLAVEHGEVPPSLHFRRPNPRLDLGPFFVADRLLDWPRRDGGGTAAPRRAGVSSFGIGGTNAHVVLEEAPAAAPRAAAAGPHLLVLSAADPEALARRTAALAAHLGERPGLDAADVAHTLLAGRKPLALRRAAVVADLADAATLLARPDDPRWGLARAAGPPPPVAFLFPGQGAQQPGVGDELYGRLPVFRRWIDAAREALAAAMEPHAFAALAPLLPGAAAPARDAAAAERLAHTALAQPALFAVEHALAQVWLDWGVEPEAMAGHSVGEWVAATLAGVVSFADAARLVAERGRLMGDLPRGAMLAVPLAEERLAALLPEVAPGLAVAAVNAPGLCAVAGPSAAVDALARRLAADGVEARRLTTSHAFHSPLVEPAVEPFRAAVAAVPLAPPRRPFLSSATGTWITPEEATDPGYWAGQVRRTVRFSAAVEALLAEPRRVLVEVGPGSSLASLVRRHPGGRERVVLPGLPRRGGEGGGEAAALLGAAARLWLAGVDLADAALDADRPRRRVSLPGYPFAGPRYWIDRPGAGRVEREGAPGAPGGERRAAAGEVGGAAEIAPAAFGERGRPEPRRPEVRMRGPVGGDGAAGASEAGRAVGGGIGDAPADLDAVAAGLRAAAAETGAAARAGSAAVVAAGSPAAETSSADGNDGRGGSAAAAAAGGASSKVDARPRGGAVGVFRDRLSAGVDSRAALPSPAVAGDGRTGGDAGDATAPLPAVSGAVDRLVAAGGRAGAADGAPVSAAGGGQAAPLGVPFAAGDRVTGDPVADPAGGVAKRADPGDWFYLPVWKGLPPVDLLAPRGTGDERAAAWLLVGAGGGLAEPLAARLAAGGGRVAVAVAGERFERLAGDRFTLRPGEPADAEALLAAVAAGGAPPRVVWLDPLAGGGAGAADPAGLAAALLVLARALSAAAAGEEPCRLLAVSDGLWQVAGEPVRAPERAAAEGLARVLPQELPGLACRWIDLPPGPGEGAVDLLAAELAAAPSAAAGAPPRVAQRGGRRWLEVWEPLPVPPPAAGAGFRRRGRYLVTGGVGRFGVATARRLAASHDARLLLLDTRPVDPGLLAELAAAGGEVEAIAGDVADPAAVAAALARAADRWGGLDGVLHAAGRPATDFRPQADLGRDELAAHLSAKLGGLAALRAGLDRLAAERPGVARPAFVLATSSLAPLLGGVGLGAFAAADAALDAACAAAPRAAGAAWSSVAWEVWEQGFDAGGGVGRQQAALALAEDELVAALERAAAVARLPRLAVASGDLAARIAQWTAPLPPRRRAAASRDERLGEVHAPEDPVERRIAEVWREVLGVPAVGRDDDFFLLGGDSLSGLQVLSKLRAELAVELPLQSFFEARTPAGMAAVVAAERGRREGDDRRIAELLAEVEGLGDEEVAALLAGEEEGASSEVAS